MICLLCPERSDVVVFFFGIIIGVVIGGTAVYAWLDHMFAKYVKEVRDDIANQLPAAFDE